MTNLRLRRVSYLFLALAFILLFAACKNAEAEILGQWKKPAAITTTDGMTSMGCDMLYPQVLEFFDDGTYAGTAGQMWPGGEYRIVESGRIRLNTLQGGVSVYEFLLEDDALTFKEGSCEFTYQRVH